MQVVVLVAVGVVVAFATAVAVWTSVASDISGLVAVLGWWTLLVLLKPLVIGVLAWRYG